MSNVAYCGKHNLHYAYGCIRCEEERFRTDPEVKAEVAKDPGKEGYPYGRPPGCVEGLPTTEDIYNQIAAVVMRGTHLPTDATERKSVPVCTGALDYFPDAIAAVAELSWKATQQHHPGAPMHWDRNKSSDHPDCLLRHLMERGTLDTDGVRHSAKVAWRALAILQLEIEADRARNDPTREIGRSAPDAEPRNPAPTPIGKWERE